MLFGDINFDFKISMKDVTLLQRAIAGLEPITALQKAVANVDYDVFRTDVIGMGDVTTLQRKIASLENFEHEYFGLNCKP